MAGSKAPYFPFYPDDFEYDPIVEAMTAEQAGCYIRILCRAWRENPRGSIPDDDEKLARWARVSNARWSKIKAGVLAAFQPPDGGRRVQKRMAEESEKLERKSKSASDSASHRWECERSAKGVRTHSDGNARAFGSDSVSGSGSSLGVRGAGRGVVDPAADLADLWSFHCTRKRSGGMPADVATEKAGEFAEAMRLGLAFETIREAILDPARNRNEHLWQFWKRLEAGAGKPDALDGLRLFVEQGERKHEAC